VQQCRHFLSLEQRADAIVQEKTPSGSPPELLQLAQFCQQFRRPYHAARLFALAFASRPHVTEDLAKGLRTQAACVAARAAAGQGWDADKLDAEQKTQLRRQALDWLRADLKLLTKTLAGYRAAGAGNQEPASPLAALAGTAARPGPADLLRVCDRLKRWRTDLDLAGLRDEKELAKLPPPEQQGWHKFWDEVRTLNEQLHTCFSEKRLTGSFTGPQKEQVHEVQLQAGKTYAFDLESKEFDAFLRLHDARGQKLAENDDIEPGVIQDSRIVFRPREGGTYRLVATSVQGQGSGAYTLIIREFSPAKE
jgi:hypothetical protein